MAKEANKKLIGGFVVGAIALAVAAVAILGSSELFTRKSQYVAFFDESVLGLNVGSAVVYRGVQIGRVTRIEVRINPKTFTVKVPVFFEIQANRFQLAPGTTRDDVDLDAERDLAILVDRGLRARLQSVSLVTGQMLIELDFYPDRPIQLVHEEPDFLEIPTIPSGIKQLVRRIENLPIEELMDKLTAVVTSIDKTVNSADFQDAVKGLNEAIQNGRKALAEVQNFTRNLDRRTERLTTSLDETARQYTQLARTAQEQVEAVGARTAELAEATQQAVQSVRNSVGEDSPVYYMLINTLEEMTAMSRSIRALTQYLQQNPDAVIWGKGGGKP